MKQKTIGNLYILAAAVLWSTGGLLMKYVSYSGIVTNCLRTFVAFLFFVVVNKGIHIKLNKHVVFAAIGLASVTTLFTMANKLTTAANAIVLQYLSPIFVLIFTCLKEHKLPTLRQVVIVSVTFMGMFLFFMDQLQPGYFLGNVLAILAGIGFAVVFLFNSYPDSSAQDANLLGFMISFVIGLPFMVKEKVTFEAVNVICIVVLGVFQLGLPYLLFGHGLKYTTPVSGSLISMLEAVLNPIWVFLFYHEQPGKYALIGIAIILCMVFYNTITDQRD